MRHQEYNDTPSTRTPGRRAIPAKPYQVNSCKGPHKLAVGNEHTTVSQVEGQARLMHAGVRRMKKRIPEVPTEWHCETAHQPVDATHQPVRLGR